MSVAEALLGSIVRGDVDTMLGCFNVDAVYHDLLLGTWRGEAELRVLFERMVAECQGLELTVDRVGTGPGIEFAEWTSRYTVGPSVAQAAGQCISLRGVSVLELTDGRCSVYREYFDRGKALVEMGLPATDVHKVLSRPPRGR